MIQDLKLFLKASDERSRVSASHFEYKDCRSKRCA